MRRLSFLHRSGIRVEHHFDIGGMLLFYEDLCGEIMFSDYEEQKARRDRLLRWVEEHRFPEVLAHIDPVKDNFIFTGDYPSGGEEAVHLIDWEYAGMCDPMIDLGMCAIYSYMEEEKTERLMEAYFGRPAETKERLLVYAYMALGGLLWALWGLYKESLGVQFSDYTIRMYRYFKKYASYVLDENSEKEM